MALTPKTLRLNENCSQNYENYRYSGCNRVGQNRKPSPYMTICLVNSLPKMPYIHRLYMVLANPKLLLSSELTSSLVLVLACSLVLPCSLTLPVTNASCCMQLLMSPALTSSLVLVFWLLACSWCVHLCWYASPGLQAASYKTYPVTTVQKQRQDICSTRTLTPGASPTCQFQITTHTWE